MKKQIESGNGVTVVKPKLVREILSIINMPGKTRMEKIAALKAVDFSGRPGQDEANAITQKYRNKFQDSETRKITGKFPRGENRIIEKYENCKWMPRLANFKRDNWSSTTELSQYKNFKKSRWQDAFEKQLKSRFPSIELRLLAPDLTADNYLQFAASNPFKKAAELQAAADKLKADKKAFSKETGLPGSFFGHEKSIEEIQSYKWTSSYAKVADWYVTIDFDNCEDWEAYSSAWHRSHGPKRWVENRRVIFTKPGEKKEFPLDSFAGAFLFKAIIETLQLEKPKVDKTTKAKLSKFQAVQLNPYFDVRVMKIAGHIVTGERLFAGSHYDFFITDGKDVYHSGDKSDLAAGLRRKQEAAAKAEANRLEAENTVLTIEIVTDKQGRYGFCETGVRQFAELNGLDANGSYTVREIRQAVVAKRKENCARFASELKSVGIILNCK